MSSSYKEQFLDMLGMQNKMGAMTNGLARQMQNSNGNPDDFLKNMASQMKEMIPKEDLSEFLTFNTRKNGRICRKN